MGFVALGIVLVTLVAGRRLPGGLPGAFVSVVAALAVYTALRMMGLVPAAPGAAVAAKSTLALAVPWPSLAFLGGLGLAWGYLPIVLPFGVMTIIGGIDADIDPFEVFNLAQELLMLTGLAVVLGAVAWLLTGLAGLLWVLLTVLLLVAGALAVYFAYLAISNP